MKNNLIHLLFAEIDNLVKRDKKARKNMSKLTDAVDTIKTEVADLKARAADKHAADTATIATLTAENEKASADLTSVSLDVKAIDAAPSAADTGTAPPSEPQPASSVSAG